MHHHQQRWKPAGCSHAISSCLPLQRRCWSGSNSNSSPPATAASATAHPSLSRLHTFTHTFWLTCRYETHIKLAKDSLGTNSFRFSFEWARLEPEGPGKVDEAAVLRCAGSTTAGHRLQRVQGLGGWHSLLFRRVIYLNSKSPLRQAEPQSTKLGGLVKESRAVQHAW